MVKDSTLNQSQVIIDLSMNLQNDLLWAVEPDSQTGRLWLLNVPQQTSDIKFLLMGRS